MNTRVDGIVAVLALVVVTGAPAGAWAAEWCNPVPITELNSLPGSDNDPDVSTNERTIYFASNRDGGEGLGDIYASRRASRRDGWDPPVNVDAVKNQLYFSSARARSRGPAPVNLGPPINTSLFEGGPRLSSDGRALYFFRGTTANVDLFVSRRAGDDGTCDE